MFMGEICVRGKMCSWKEVFMEEISVRGKSVHREISVHGRKYVFVEIGVRGELVLVKKSVRGKKKCSSNRANNFFFCRVGIKRTKRKKYSGTWR